MTETFQKGWFKPPGKELWPAELLAEVKGNTDGIEDSCKCQLLPQRMSSVIVMSISSLFSYMFVCACLCVCLCVCVLWYTECLCPLFQKFIHKLESPLYLQMQPVGGNWVMQMNHSWMGFMSLEEARNLATCLSITWKHKKSAVWNP